MTTRSTARRTAGLSGAVHRGRQCLRCHGRERPARHHRGRRSSWHIRWRLGSAGSGVFLDTWAAEDELNQLLGISAATSRGGDPYRHQHTIPLCSQVVTRYPPRCTGFDADLMTIASADFAAATTEFTTYLDGLANFPGRPRRPEQSARRPRPRQPGVSVPT